MNYQDEPNYKFFSVIYRGITGLLLLIFWYYLVEFILLFIGDLIKTEIKVLNFILGLILIFGTGFIVFILRIKLNHLYDLFYSSLRDK
jgi:hypothetical protein